MIYVRPALYCDLSHYPPFCVYTTLIRRSRRPGSDSFIMQPSAVSLPQHPQDSTDCTDCRSMVLVHLIVTCIMYVTYRLSFVVPCSSIQWSVSIYKRSPLGLLIVCLYIVVVVAKEVIDLAVNTRQNVAGLKSPIPDHNRFH